MVWYTIRNRTFGNLLLGFWRKHLGVIYMTEKKVYRATMYLRLSKEDNDGAVESMSITNQKDLIRAYVDGKDDIEIVSERIDDGYSGGNFERPSFQLMMEDVKKGIVDCIIVKDLSRLGREYIETGVYLREIFPKFGVRFISVVENIDSSKDAKVGEQLEVTLRTMMNDSYSYDIAQKTRTALQTKRDKGQFIGANVIYGYKRSENDRNSLVIDEYPAKIVRDIFAMKKSGYSAASIAEALNEKAVLSPNEYKKSQGIPVPKGGFTDKEDGKWSATTIIRFLKNEIYTGTLVQGKQTTLTYKLKNVKHKPKDEWSIVPNAHEAIISTYDFDLVQKLMNLDTRTSPKAESVYLFSGLLICGCCGNRMTRKTVPYKGKKYYYYYCPTGKKHGCDLKMVKEEELLECITLCVKQHIENVLGLEELVDKVGDLRWNKEMSDKITEQIQNIEAEMEKTSLFLSKLYENLVHNYITKSEYADMKKDYSKKLSLQKQRKVSLKKELHEASLEAKQDNMWQKAFQEFETMETLSRSCLIQLVETITLGKEFHINIQFRFQSEYEQTRTVLEKVSGVM